MKENIAFDIPHRPNTTGVRYTLWTEHHDNAADELTPCAARLYRWMLEQAPGGVSHTVEFADFQSSTICRKRQTGYHIKHILRSFKELLEAGLARVTRWYGNGKRIVNVVVRHSGAIRPFQLLGQKNSRRQEKILHGSKKFQSEAETRISAYSIQSKSKKTTDTHPPHPAAVIFKNCEKEEKEANQGEMKCKIPQSIEEEVELEAVEQTDSDQEQTDSAQELTDSDQEQTDSAQEQTDSAQELTDSGKHKFSARAEQSEKLDRINDVGIRLNRQLEALVRNFTRVEQTDSAQEQTDSDQEQTDSDQELTNSDEELTNSDEELTNSDEELTDSDEELTDSDEELTDSDEELTDSDEELTDSGEHKFSARAQQSQKLDRINDVGIRLNRQLEALVRDFTLVEVKQAIAYYLEVKRIKHSKGQKIDRPAGWLTDCLRQRWWQTAQRPEKTKEQEEFETWYSLAIASGIVENLPINYLSRDHYNQPLVRVPKPGLFGAPYTLVPWRELWKATPNPSTTVEDPDADNL